MRLALAQINTTVGDFAGNLARVRAAAERAGDADLVVFPELTLCGYMPRDLLSEASFLDACARALDEVVAWRGFPPLLVGVPLRADGPGKPLVNAAVLVRDGRADTVAKRLLPTYDVFDEARYFRSGTKSAPVDVGGVKVGVTICEDMWAGSTYADDPVAELTAQGADVIVNLSASPFEPSKPAVRRELARRAGVPFAFCNLVGANDQLVFDGNSFAVDAAGRVCAHAAAFAEDVIETGFDGAAEAPPAPLRAAVVLGIRDYFEKTGFTDALVGMSGGVDSSLVAALAAEALGPAHVCGVAMPGPFNAPMSLEDAREVARRLGIACETAPIHGAYDRVREDLRDVRGDPPFGVADENLQARLRGAFLMTLANDRGALVLVPSNKSELALGYCTLYGDMVGALSPIADLYKTQVVELAREFDLPERVLTRAPSAELRPDQKDEDTLPPYDVLDGILRLHLEERRRPAEIVAAGFDAATVARVLRGVAATEYKRQQAAPVLKLSSKAFDLGRRLPIVERFRGGAE